MTSQLISLSSCADGKYPRGYVGGTTESGVPRFRLPAGGPSALGGPAQDRLDRLRRAHAFIEKHDLAGIDGGGSALVIGMSTGMVVAMLGLPLESTALVIGANAVCWTLGGLVWPVAAIIKKIAERADPSLKPSPPTWTGLSSERTSRKGSVHTGSSLDSSHAVDVAGDFGSSDGGS